MTKINEKWIMLILLLSLILGFFINKREPFSNKTNYPIGGDSVNPDMSNKTFYIYPIGGNSVNPDTSNKNNSQQLLSTQIILLIIIIVILLYFIIVK
jgi:hypothetical protein